MKTKITLVFLLLCNLLTACQAATPQPITSTIDTEFALASGQNVSLPDANLSITFVSVAGDERCPSEIECAMSGPVTINLSVRDKNGTVSEEVLRTFTDNSGLAPAMEFEGVKSSVSIDEYQIKIISVLPYPKKRSSSIKASEYKLTLKVTRN